MAMTHKSQGMAVQTPQQLQHHFVFGCFMYDPVYMGLSNIDLFFCTMNESIFLYVDRLSSSELKCNVLRHVRKVHTSFTTFYCMKCLSV